MFCDENKLQVMAANLKLLVYEALSYLCMRPSATGVSGLKLLVSANLKLVIGYEASSY